MNSILNQLSRMSVAIPESIKTLNIICGRGAAKHALHIKPAASGLASIMSQPAMAGIIQRNNIINQSAMPAIIQRFNLIKAARQNTIIKAKIIDEEPISCPITCPIFISSPIEPKSDYPLAGLDYLNSIDTINTSKPKKSIRKPRAKVLGAFALGLLLIGQSPYMDNMAAGLPYESEHNYSLYQPMPSPTTSSYSLYHEATPTSL